MINNKISISKLKQIAKDGYGNLVKVVVDIKQKIMAIGRELHIDEETILLESGSEQKNLWGINIYPDKPRDEWIEFDLMVNLRPSLKNFTRGVDNSEIQQKIKSIVNELLI